MAEAPHKKNRTDGTTTSSSSPARDLPVSVAPLTENGQNLLSISSTADPPPALRVPDDRLAFLKLKRAALEQEIATIDQEIQYLVAERNPFLRALGKAPEVMFSFLDMKDANTLKLVCKQLREDVRNAFWSVHTDEMADDESQQVANLRKWRDAYPNALSAVLSQTATFPSEHYVHLQGVRYLHLNGNKSIRDAAFGHFQTFRGEKGIHTLYMNNCTQITDKAFESLRGIHTLDMGNCTQITDEAFEKLRGISTLNMGGCSASSIFTATRVLGIIPDH